MRDTFNRWLADGKSWIGVFQNQDLGHPDTGRRIALCYDDSQYWQMAVGQARAPDHRDIGMGWRYVLQVKCRTVEEAVAAMDESGAAPYNPHPATGG